MTQTLTDKSDQSKQSEQSDIFVVLGIGSYYGAEGKDGDGSDADVGADSVRLVTTSEDEARFLVGILNAPRLAYETKKREYEDAKSRIRKQEVPDFMMSPPSGPTDTSDYKSWHAELRNAFARCHKRWESELPAKPPARPVAMSEKYIIVKMPLGQPVDLLLADVVEPKDWKKP